MLPPGYGGHSAVGNYDEQRVSSHAPTTPSQTDLWSLAPLIGGRGRVRIAHWDGRRHRWDYRARDERPLTADVPRRPAAVMLYDSHGQCRTLVVDVDVDGHDGQALTHQIVALLQRCGARVLVDRSPAGKHHVYVPLRDPLSVEDAGRLAKALARRFPGVDPLPHTTGATSGCIRTPGSPYKTGDGHQELVTDLAAARRALMTRNGSDVLGRLERELVDELAAVRRETLTLATPLAQLEAENPVDHAPLDGPVLSARMLQIAREGLYDQAGYADRSTARQAVLTAARRAGYEYADVVARIEDGRWPGLRAMYQNATTRWRTLLARTEWPKAVALVAATPRTEKPVRHCNTSEENQVTGGAADQAEPEKSAFVEHRYLRRFRTTLRATHATEFPGRQGRLLRLVLQVLAAAAHKTGSRYIEFGVRSHSLSLPWDPSQVSRALVALRDQDDPWIVLERDGRGTRADLYSLRIPDRYRELAQTLLLEDGKIHGLRPAFRVLGVEASIVFEAIERGATTALDVVAATALARSTVYEHAGILEAWGLIAKTVDGNWKAHPELLGRVAELVGADVTIACLLRRVRAQRDAWHARLARAGTAPETWWDQVTKEGPPDDPLHHVA